MIRPAARRSGATVADDHVAAGAEIEEVGAHLLIRSVGEHVEEQVELLAELNAPDDVTVVVVAVPGRGAETLWPRLAELPSRTLARIVLAMSGAGIAGLDRPALAQRMADAWKRTVIAPAGDAVLVPGGMLFAHGDARVPAEDAGDAGPPIGDAYAGSKAQWWAFAPDTEPELLGPRWPVPEWQAAVARPTAPALSASAGPSSPSTAGPPGRSGQQGSPGASSAEPRTPAAPHAPLAPSGPVVTTIPAGLLVRRGGTAPPEPGDIAFAVPAAPDRPTILVGMPDGPRVTAADLIAALAGPLKEVAWRRHPVRLVPGDGGDLLPLGETLARELNVEVEVLTGLPVSVVDPDARRQRVVLADAAGRLTWSPFVTSVICRPPAVGGAAPPLRPEGWNAPVAGPDLTAPGVMRLDDGWRLAVTRAGMWVFPADADPDRFPGELLIRWPVAVDTVRLDVGIADDSVDDSVWPLLDDLIGALPAESRARLMLAVHGDTTPDGDLALRRLAIARDVRLEPATAAASRADLPPAPPNAAVASVSVPPPATALIPRAQSLPATASRRSTEEEREAFRAMIGLRWNTHAAAVRRASYRLPAIAAGEWAAAAADLVAVRLYIIAQQTEPEGDFGSTALRSGDEWLRPYLACLASGLGRLPTYRGAVLRGVDAAALDLARLRSGSTVLTDPGPVGGRSLPAAGRRAEERRPPPTTGMYVIWSDTARRLGAVLGTEPGGNEGTPGIDDDIMFTPGSRFAVLDIGRGDADTPDVAFLREIPDAVDDPGGHLALSRLEKALVDLGAVADPTPWPAHCLGAIAATVSGQATTG